ncbi:Ras guanine nucleotide exchange factor F [Diplonema papillatum]|nr:Ras guanine nucleotide exchange factor F [Diplonema papillatum]
MVVYGGAVAKKVWLLHLGGAWKWSERVCAGDVPPARLYHSACEYGGTMLMYGGELPATTSEADAGETPYFELDLESFQWRQVRTAGASPGHRSHHSATLYNGTLYIIGGKRTAHGRPLKLTNAAVQSHVAGGFHDIFSLNVTGRTWGRVERVDSIHPLVWGHSAVMFRHYILIYGGFHLDGRPGESHPESPPTVTLSDVVYSYNTEMIAWSKSTPKKPCPTARALHSAVVCLSEMMVCGGVSTGPGGKLELTTDAWLWDVATGDWRQLPFCLQTWNSKRLFCATATDANRDVHLAVCPGLGTCYTINVKDQASGWQAHACDATSLCRVKSDNPGNEQAAAPRAGSHHNGGPLRLNQTPPGETPWGLAQGSAPPPGYVYGTERGQSGSPAADVTGQAVRRQPLFALDGSAVGLRALDPSGGPNQAGGGGRWLEPRAVVPLSHGGDAAASDRRPPLSGAFSGGTPTETVPGTRAGSAGSPVLSANDRDDPARPNSGGPGGLQQQLLDLQRQLAQLTEAKRQLAARPADDAGLVVPLSAADSRGSPPAAGLHWSGGAAVPSFQSTVDEVATLQQQLRSLQARKLQMVQTSGAAPSLPPAIPGGDALPFGHLQREKEKYEAILQQLQLQQQQQQHQQQLLLLQQQQQQQCEQRPDAPALSAGDRELLEKELALQREKLEAQRYESVLRAVREDSRPQHPHGHEHQPSAIPAGPMPPMPSVNAGYAPESHGASRSPTSSMYPPFDPHYSHGVSPPAPSHHAFARQSSTPPPMEVVASMLHPAALNVRSSSPPAPLPLTPRGGGGTAAARKLQNYRQHKVTKQQQIAPQQRQVSPPRRIARQPSPAANDVRRRHHLSSLQVKLREIEDGVAHEFDRAAGPEPDLSRIPAASDAPPDRPAPAPFAPAVHTGLPASHNYYEQPPFPAGSRSVTPAAAAPPFDSRVAAHPPPGNPSHPPTSVSDRSPYPVFNAAMEGPASYLPPPSRAAGQPGYLPSNQNVHRHISPTKLPSAGQTTGDWAMLKELLGDEYAQIDAGALSIGRLLSPPGSPRTDDVRYPYA